MSGFGSYGPAAAVCGTGLALCGLNGLFFMDTEPALLLVSGWLAVSAAMAGGGGFKMEKIRAAALALRQPFGWLAACGSVCSGCAVRINLACRQSLVGSSNI